MSNTDTSNNKGFKVKQLLFSILVIGLAVFVVVALVKMRKAPKQVKPAVVLPLVTTIELEGKDVEMQIKGNGSVIAKTEVDIVAQVGGKIVEVNADFVSGGFIKAGVEILKIEPKDYELAVEQAQAGVAEAIVNLETEQSEAVVAMEEWKQLHGDAKPTSDLVLRKPQIRQAKAKLQSAEATLASAKLNLERTSVTLPIDVVIEDEAVDLGEYVSVGKTVGSAYGIEAVEIEVPLKDKELEWFDVPMINGDDEDEPLTEATVTADFAGNVYSWDGVVTRTTGQVDIKSRFVSVVVEVAEPFSYAEGKPALMPGIFVDVCIKGKTLKNAVAIPRTALHNRNQIWVIEDEKLYIRDIDIVRMDDEYAYVVEGIEDGSVVVTSSLDAISDGMSVRVESD